jgi:hypothetical protein
MRQPSIRAIENPRPRRLAMRLAPLAAAFALIMVSSPARAEFVKAAVQGASPEGKVTHTLSGAGAAGEIGTGPRGQDRPTNGLSGPATSSPSFADPGTSSSHSRTSPFSGGSGGINSAAHAVTSPSGHLDPVGAGTSIPVQDKPKANPSTAFPAESWPQSRENNQGESDNDLGILRRSPPPEPRPHPHGPPPGHDHHHMPEPPSVVLAGIGAAGILVLSWWKRRRMAGAGSSSCQRAKG